MRDHLTIGPTPSGEDCAQVGSPDYAKQARKECTAFINQLRRKFGPEPDGADLRIKSNPHDFGSYYDVACYYDTDDEAAVAYALKCEGETPEEWDDEARKELNGEPRRALGKALRAEPTPPVKRWNGTIPNCDFCGTRGFVDGKTKQGPWAVMCPPCAAAHGIGIGPGIGQEYDRTGELVAGSSTV
jgi:hypothetical protein